MSYDAELLVVFCSEDRFLTLQITNQNGLPLIDEQAQDYTMITTWTQQKVVCPTTAPSSYTSYALQFQHKRAFAHCAVLIDEQEGQKLNWSL
jgi:hypothetical protein